VVYRRGATARSGNAIPAPTAIVVDEGPASPAAPKWAASGVMLTIAAALPGAVTYRRRDLRL
jgi:hypothetical protein